MKLCQVFDGKGFLGCMTGKSRQEIEANGAMQYEYLSSTLVREPWTDLELPHAATYIPAVFYLND